MNLFILRQSPYNGTLAREALDMALAFAAFDEPVQLLFYGDGVFQLLAGQQTNGLGIKNISKTLDALPVYDITAVFASHDCLMQRGLTTEQLSLPVSLLDNSAIQALICDADKIMSL